MATDIHSLVQRWIDRFGETPVLIDEALMEALLAQGDDCPDALASLTST